MELLFKASLTIERQIDLEERNVIGVFNEVSTGVGPGLVLGHRRANFSDQLLGQTTIFHNAIQDLRAVSRVP